jgi:hypothetical protein
MNKYGIYFHDTRESIGPVTALVKDWFVLPEVINAMNVVGRTVAIVDINGAVLISHAKILETSIENEQTQFKIFQYYD